MRKKLLAHNIANILTCADVTGLPRNFVVLCSFLDNGQKCTVQSEKHHCSQATRVAMDTMQCSVQKYWLAASMIVIHREPEVLSIFNPSIPQYEQGCIQDFFMGGGHTLVRPLGGLVACSPRKFFVFYVGL